MSQPYSPPPGYPGGNQLPPYQGANPAETSGQPGTLRVEPNVVKPLLTYAILGLTILVYIAQVLSESMMGIDIPAALGVKSNEAILQGQLWRLFTPMLLHGSLMHLLFNMYALMAFGPTLESYYGHVRYLALYVLAGFAGNVASFIFSPANSLGSSTAIFGLLGAYGVFLYQNRELLGGRGRRGLVNIIVIAGINLLIGTMPGIDNWGHIGGLVGGVIFGWFGGPKLTLQRDYAAVRIEDERQPGDALRAGLLVGLVFGGLLLAAVLLGWV